MFGRTNWKLAQLSYGGSNSLEPGEKWHEKSIHSFCYRNEIQTFLVRLLAWSRKLLSPQRIDAIWRIFWNILFVLLFIHLQSKHCIFNGIHNRTIKHLRRMLLTTIWHRTRCETTCTRKRIWRICSANVEVDGSNVFIQFYCVYITNWVIMYWKKIAVQISRMKIS